MTTIDGITVWRRPRRPLDAPSTSLLLVQTLLGYEWLVSGLSKIANGDFAKGLGLQIDDMARTAPSWYAAFLKDAVVPHAAAFGYLIEGAELVAGVALLGTAAAQLGFARARTPRARRAFRAITAAALVAGIVLVANFELANGGSFGLRLAADSFDEGVDLDTLMVAAQLALLVPLVPALRRPRRNETQQQRSTR